MPPSSFLSFLATVVVHPSTTTQAKPADGIAAANQALQYLQYLCEVVGPVNSCLSSAFSFNRTSSLRGRASLGKRRREDDAHGDDDDNSQVLNTKLAQDQSLWTRGESFWRVVGWAFNCAAISQVRWQRWRIWLEFMIEVLEADLVEQVSNKSKEKGEELIRKSLVVQLMTGTAGSISQQERRRAMRAIFAHGSSRDVAEFKEIWKDETRERVVKDERIRDQPIKNRKGLASLESDDEDNDGSRNLGQIEDLEGARQTRQTNRDAKPAQDSDDIEEPDTENVIEIIERYGGSDAVYLRRRLLRLVSYAPL